MRTDLEPAPWWRGRPSETLIEALRLLRHDVWSDAATAFYARRLGLLALGKQAPKGVQPFLNDVVDERFAGAGWLGSDGRFSRGSTWVRVTFRHQMSLGSDIVDAIKVCRKDAMTEAAILAASDRFLDVITPNDARALVSFEKLAARSPISTAAWTSRSSSGASSRRRSCRPMSPRRFARSVRTTPTDPRGNAGKACTAGWCSYVRTERVDDDVRAYRGRFGRCSPQ